MPLACCSCVRVFPRDIFYIVHQLADPGQRLTLSCSKWWLPSTKRATLTKHALPAPSCHILLLSKPSRYLLLTIFVCSSHISLWIVPSLVTPTTIALALVTPCEESLGTLFILIVQHETWMTSESRPVSLMFAQLHTGASKLKQTGLIKSTMSILFFLLTFVPYIQAQLGSHSPESDSTPPGNDGTTLGIFLACFFGNYWPSHPGYRPQTYPPFLGSIVILIILAIAIEILSARKRAKLSRSLLARQNLARQNVAPMPSDYGLSPIPVDRPDSPLYKTEPPPPAYTNNPIVNDACAGVRSIILYIMTQDAWWVCLRSLPETVQKVKLSPVRCLCALYVFFLFTNYRKMWHSSDRFLCYQPPFEGQAQPSNSEMSICPVRFYNWIVKCEHSSDTIRCISPRFHQQHMFMVIIFP